MKQYDDIFEEVIDRALDDEYYLYTQSIKEEILTGHKLYYKELENERITLERDKKSSDLRDLRRQLRLLRVRK